MNLVEEYIFTVQPFEVDFRGNLTFPLLINNLLNAAGHHADKRHFGITDINKENKTWVLSRLAIELTQQPICGDAVKIETWVEGIMRSFTMRNFAIYNKDGKAIGHARSIWAMIDTETRKPVNLEGTTITEYLYKEKECPIGKIGKIGIAESSASDALFSVKYSDIDINRHMNSAKYIEHIVDVLNEEQLTQNSIKRLEIEYNEECRMGEIIHLAHNEQSENHHLITLQKEDGTIICKSTIQLQRNIL